MNKAIKIKYCSGLTSVIGYEPWAERAIDSAKQSLSDGVGVEINPSAIAIEDTVIAKCCGDDLFRASFKLKNNCIKGYYGIPIRLILPNDGGYIDSMFRLELQSMNSLPTKVFLKDFAQPIKQENDLYSGAALAQLLMEQYGKSINQKDFRDIIDYVKSKSRWKDADFQTWRLILKRVLSNPHSTLDDFIQSEEL